MSRRAECRRQVRNSRRPLSGNEIVRLNDQRALPKDHPSYTKRSTIDVSLDTSLHAIDVVERSGTAPIVERELRSHPGKTSELSLTALLVAIELCAETSQSYRRTDLCAVLNGLDARAAFKLGLCDRTTRKIVSYNVVDKQCLRLEKALRAGWLHKDGTNCDKDWFCRCFVEANITPEQAEQVTAIALDSTFVRTWAAKSRYPEGAPPPDTADPDATWGHRSGTGKHKARIDVGYDLHMGTPVRSSHWKGRIDNANLGDPMPLIAAHMVLTSAGIGVAFAGVQAVENIRKIFPHVNEVVADRGYSTKPVDFNRVLHKQGINVVMDYKTDKRNKAKQRCFGRKPHRLIEHCGTFLPVWLPKNLYTPPKDFADEKLTEWYDNRAIYRYSATPLGGGSFQFVCPQCSGRITSNLKTRNKNVEVNKTAPYIHIKNNEAYCCPGKVTIGVEKLDYYQKIPYGTTAWKQSYGRRPQIENLNSILKDKNGLSDGWCRAFRNEPRFIGSVMLGVAHMMRENKPAWISQNKQALTNSNGSGTSAAANDSDTSVAENGSDTSVAANDSDDNDQPGLDQPPTGAENTDSIERSRDKPP